MKFTLLSLAVLTLSAAPRPQESRYHECLNGNRKGLIMEGYDPVSYFKEGGEKPKKGKKNLVVTYRQGKYRFANARHRDMFLAHPSRFAPAYGGWCAYAMAKDKLVDISPKSYLMVDGSLMLYFDSFFDDTRANWLKAGGNVLLPRADKAWKRRSAETRQRSVVAYHLNGDLALGGFDPVSYHRPTGPQQGKESLTTRDRGITYMFATQENRLAFIADPDRYEPAFGGWCAMGMAAGKRLPAHPEEFLIEKEGRLLVFAEGELSQVETWKLDANRKRASAVKNWRGMLQQTP